MNNVMTKYKFSISFLIIFFASLFCSRWTQYRFPLSLGVARGITVIGYMPFIVWIIKKIIIDINNKVLIEGKGKQNAQLFYYILWLYYLSVSIIRLMVGEAIKESVYYIIVFMGVISFFMLEYNKANPNIINNIRVCSMVMNLSWMLFLFYGHKIFLYSPININIICCSVILLLLGNMVYMYRGKAHYCDKINIVFNIVCVLTSGSRGSFCLLLCVVLILLFYMFINKSIYFVRFGFLVMVSILICMLMFAFNVYSVRGNVYRELWLISDVLIDKTNIATYDNLVVQEQSEQIERSDQGRVYLIKRGVDEIKKSPLIGTGDVEYEQFIVSADGLAFAANQSSHCFVIEFLVCFGGIGTLIAFILQWKLIKNIVEKNNNIFVFLVVMAFFGEAIVQPLYFNNITLLLFALAILAIQSSLLEEKEIKIDNIFIE